MKKCDCAEWIANDKGANVYRCRKHELIFINQTGFVSWSDTLGRGHKDFEKWWFRGY